MHDARGFACLAVLLVGCGGSFGVKVPEGDAGDEVAALDASASDASEASDSGNPTGDARVGGSERDPLPDASGASDVVAVSDAGDEAPVDDAGCTPYPHGSNACPGGAGASTPSQVCVWFPYGSLSTTIATPAACQCASTYDCTCLFANAPLTCGAGLTMTCSDSSDGPVVTCS